MIHSDFMSDVDFLIKNFLSNQTKRFNLCCECINLILESVLFSRVVNWRGLLSYLVYRSSQCVWFINW